VSRAGRGSGPAAKKRELHGRLQAAVADHEAEAEAEAAPAPPGMPEDVRASWEAMPPEVRAAWQAQRVFAYCKNRITLRDRPLWPAEMVGAMLADEWLALVQQRMMEMAVANMQARTEAVEIEVPA
jgi:hypothetical protein